VLRLPAFQPAGAPAPARAARQRAADRVAGAPPAGRTTIAAHRWCAARRDVRRAASGASLDLFAHLASGALLGRAFRPTGEHWASFALFGAAAAISPDVDAPLALLGTETWAKYHQVFTHSLVGLAVVPLGLSLLPFRFAPWRTRYVLALSGWCLHVSLDLCANWEVPVPWPLSQDRWALQLLDQDFSWPLDMLLVVGLALTLWQPAMRHARTLSIATAVLLALWLAIGLPT
jgi:membrane-bound metal-dependent hydrolase YbcI (DUF457 family)